MKDMITSEFHEDSTVTNNKGYREIFAFAFEDYAGKYGVKHDAIEGKRACGVILEEDDDSKSVCTFIDVVIEANYDLIIFDINRPSAQLIHAVRYCDAWKEKEYEEISGVYDDRIVFGKIIK